MRIGNSTSQLPTSRIIATKRYAFHGPTMVHLLRESSFWFAFWVRPMASTWEQVATTEWPVWTAWAGEVARMIGVPAGTRIWIVAAATDMRRGFLGLAAMVQTGLQENTFSGHVFIFRGHHGDLINVLWWSGDGLCLFARRPERGQFIWPQATSGTASLTPA